jgi:Transglycosylase SLT domain
VPGIGIQSQLDGYFPNLAPGILPLIAALERHKIAKKASLPRADPQVSDWQISGQIVCGVVTRVTMVVVVLVVLLAGCGDARQLVAQHPGVAGLADPVLASRLPGGRPRAAADPHSLARQLAAAENAVRDRATPPEVVAAAGRLAQLGYLALVDHPEWDATVLAEVPGSLRDPIGHNAAAARELHAMATRLPTTVPAWQIVEPLGVTQLRTCYAEAQQRFGVPWFVLAAVHLVESRMGRIVGHSSADAQGPMQFLPSTWARYGLGGDVWNNHDAILGAANYLAANGAADGTDAGLDKALYHYNNDSRYVRAVRHYGGVMQADERAFLGYHAWQVHYRTTLGEVLLPTGYAAAHPMPVQEWLANHPQ